jgi:hypothetical protein
MPREIFTVIPGLKGKGVDVVAAVRRGGERGGGIGTAAELEELLSSSWSQSVRMPDSLNVAPSLITPGPPHGTCLSGL